AYGLTDSADRYRWRGWGLVCPDLIGVCLADCARRHLPVAVVPASSRIAIFRASRISGRWWWAFLWRIGAGGGENSYFGWQRSAADTAVPARGFGSTQGNGAVLTLPRSLPV